jgi:arsenate reductase (glutaredoxin)
MIILYGIKNCDTVKKARAWLGERGAEYRFHDFRADGLGEGLLNRFDAALGWEALLNRRGTTWRKLSEEQREDLNREKALNLMLAQPSLIRRPVLEREGRFFVGFSADQYATELL